MNAYDVFAALKKRFPEPEWALLSEVRNAAGFNANRSIDAVAFNLWPSRGLQLVGIEIKTARGDWLQEKRDPKKANDSFKFFDRWYLATTEGVVQDGELPINWGHILDKESGRTVEVVTAPTLESIPVTRSFMAAMMKQAQKPFVDRGIAGQLQDHYTKGYKEAEARAASQIATLTATQTKLSQRLQHIATLFGMPFSSEYDIDQLAKPPGEYRRVRAHQDSFATTVQSFEYQVAKAQRDLVEVEKSLAALRSTTVDDLLVSPLSAAPKAELFGANQ